VSVPRLHPRTIEAVKERADIVDVVGEHVVLKKKGREFVGLCPFHDDKSPSMTVSPAKQFYYCFSCGAGGNSLKFLMELKRQSFSDVVMELARRYSLPVETLDVKQQERLKQQLSRRDQLHRVLSLASGFFRSNLKKPEGRQALDYLRSKRGLSEGTIEAFELGYAPEAWDGLIRHLQQAEGLAPALLEAAGLVVPRKGGNGFYDRFRHRLMVPIHDRQGRIIGFGGRSLDGSEPKYLNSPETEVFDKGKHLFGFDKAADAIRRADCAVVVEGYFDVIALHAAGIRHTVAALGTAMNSQQVTQLCRCCDSRRIVLNFDADGAGVRAAQRAIGEVEQQALQGQIELRVLHLPSGKDPDEFLQQHGPADYLALQEQAPLWLDWQIEQVLEGRDLSRADQFQQAVQGLVELLGKLPQSALRSHYLQRVAERLSGGQARLATTEAFSHALQVVAAQGRLGQLAQQLHQPLHRLLKLIRSAEIAALQHLLDLPIEPEGGLLLQRQVIGRTVLLQEFIGVFARGQMQHPQFDLPLQGLLLHLTNGPLGSAHPSAISIEIQHDAAAVATAAQLGDLLAVHGRSQSSHRVANARGMQGNHIEIALHHHGAVGPANGISRLIETE